MGPGVERELTIDVVSGENQIAAVGSPLPEPMGVRVRDPAGVGVGNVEVAWSMAGSGGAVPGMFGFQDSRTDARGFALASVILGSTAGVLRVTATVGSGDGQASTTVLATGVPGALAAANPDRLDLLVGLSLALVGLDRFGNEIPDSLLDLSADTSGVVSLGPGLVVRGHSEGTGSLSLEDGATSIQVPIKVWPPADMTELAVGFRHTCALDREGHAFCWGSQAETVQGPGFPRIGTSFAADVCRSAGGVAEVPCSEFPRPVKGSLVFEDIAVGADHSCGLAASGAVYCWGLGASVGIESAVAADGPELVAPGPFRQLAAAATHTCALRTDGVAFCWGENSKGQLGDGTFANRNTPVRVDTPLRFKAIGLGFLVSCGIDLENMLHCWGFASRIGREHPPGAEDQPAPVPVASDDSFASVGGGLEHMCALSLEGALYCWGASWDGQLGIGQIGGGFLTPERVAPATTFRSFSAGGRQTCAVDTTGLGWCWGANGAGQVGDGTFNMRIVPQPVQFESAWLQIVTGGGTAPDRREGSGVTCGIRVDGGAFCWGSNAAGQLGVGSEAVPRARPTPTSVAPAGYPPADAQEG